MAQEFGTYRRPDSRYWWIATTLPNGGRLRQSSGTENREEAEALLAKIKLDAYRETHFGVKPHRSWQEAVLRYLEVKTSLRSIRDVKRICRQLDPYLGKLTLNQINGDIVWRVVQGELKRGKPLGSTRPRMARREASRLTVMQLPYSANRSGRTRSFALPIAANRSRPMSATKAGLPQ